MTSSIRAVFTRLLCALALHKWEFVVGTRYAFCQRPDCCSVIYRSEFPHWELDICDTRLEYDWFDVELTLK